MNDPAETWMQHALAVRGVIGCGVRNPNRTLSVKTAREDFPASRITDAMPKLFEALQALQQHQVASNHLRWNFENLHIYCIGKPGGVMAVLFVNKEVASIQEMERLLLRFTCSHAPPSPEESH